MPVALAKPTDAPNVETAKPQHVTITQLPDGRIESVAVTTTKPTPAVVFHNSAHTTVWTVSASHHKSARTHAVKVLDLAMSSSYRQEDSREWVNGEDEAAAFHARHNPVRTMLRTIEAHIIRAGHADVTTGMVQCQGYGITIANGEQYDVFQGTDGTWQIAMQDWDSYDGWYIFPGMLAPATASPRAVAAATLAHVYDGTETRGELRPLARLRVAYLQWRRTPHWRNFKFHAGQWTGRHRRRITVRIPRG